MCNRELARKGEAEEVMMGWRSQAELLTGGAAQHLARPPDAEAAGAGGAGGIGEDESD